jgi:biotin carboxyl carrier protein
MTDIKFPFKLYGVTVGALLFILNACGGGRPAESDAEKIVTPVTVTGAGTGYISEAVELPARSMFLKRSIARSSTTGTVEKVAVTFGDYVKKGQNIFTVRTREASVLSDALKSDSSLAFKGEINIYASRDGIITSVSHQGGDFVQEGDELAVISDRESFVFILEVPFELNNLVSTNRQCQLIFPDGKEVTGNIGGQLPDMDQEAQTIKYFIKAPVSGLLPANLNVKVRLVKRENKSASVLPREAVLGNETQTEFWVMKLLNDSVAVKIPVKKGIENTREIEITEPLFGKTDRFVLTGGYGLPDTAGIVINKQ